MCCLRRLPPGHCGVLPRNARAEPRHSQPYRSEMILILMSRKAAFFFGSGISLASFPRVASAVGSINVASVAGITNSVFNDDWHFTSNGIFLHSPNPNPLIPDDVTPAA